MATDGAATAGDHAARWSMAGWHEVHTATLPGRSAETVSLDHLPLSPAARRLTAPYGGRLYRHQREALSTFLAGKDVCLATGTASGKTLPFLLAGIETLQREPEARVLALYPTKALLREQEQRWHDALQTAALGARVARIDGEVPVREREELIGRHHVLLATPDVLHAWLLSNLDKPNVRRFCAQLRLLVVDEVHTYAGVFGSHTAFLLRRLQHACLTLSGGRPLRYIAASATIADPDRHLSDLFARRFAVIGPESDTSPRHPLHVAWLQPSGDKDFLTTAAGLLQSLLADPAERFIAFVDSRLQAELLTRLFRRLQAGTEATERADPDDVSPDGYDLDAHELERMPVLPYRAGYIEADRVRIQQRLTQGDLRGVIATSALELGLDIPGLTTAVLMGVPRTQTSLQQRIGRVGRHGPGRVLVLHAGSVRDQRVFDDPESLFQRPLLQSSLYLGNRHLQYIHALCFASPGAEYDQVSRPQGAAAAAPPGADSADTAPITSPVGWPDGFLALCQQERDGTVPPELFGLKSFGGQSPWHAFPLRDIGAQFRLQLNQRGLLVDKGQLSHQQLMREAYPGAIHFIQGIGYRVRRLLMRERVAVITPERGPTTQPITWPVSLSPNRASSDHFSVRRHGELTLIDIGLFVTETVRGFRERRGSVATNHMYPHDLYWNRDRLTRSFHSSGVLIHHPALTGDDVQRQALAALWLEGFLYVVPFDRNDVNAGSGRLRQPVAGLGAGEPFIALYDQTYGSLRLTGHAVDASIFRRSLEEALAMAHAGDDILAEIGELHPATLAALEALVAAARTEPAAIAAAPVRSAADAAVGDWPIVIVPGHKGLLVHEAEQEFEVDAVFFSPRFGYCYRGRRVGEQGGPVTTSFPIEKVLPVPGVSQLGYYDPDTGEVIPLDEDDELGV